MKKELFPDKRANEKPFCTDIGSRIGAARQNAESLLLYWDAVKKTCEESPKSDRAAALLKLMEQRAEIILQTSFPPVIWAMFSTPIITVAERQFTTVSELVAEMKRCLTQLDQILASSEPYDNLLDFSCKKNIDSSYLG